MDSSVGNSLHQVHFFTTPALLEDIQQNAKLISFDKDDVLIEPGDEIMFLPIVTKGCIRIIRSDDDGNEVFLYHLYPGQTCTMSLTCCQTGGKSMIKAIAEDFTEMLQVPVHKTQEWYIYPEWKAFIDTHYQNRFAELMQVIDLIAFSHMDKQLHHYLEERCKASNTTVLDITHQEIAEELHTHREVISRLLRTMEQKNLVKLGRNNIELLN